MTRFLTKLQARFTLLYWKRRLFPSTVGQVPKRYLKPFILPNSVVIDAGAHIGLDSITFARMAPSVEIHSLEPVTEVYKQLIENVVSFPNIRTYKLGLSTYTGKAKINISTGSSDASSSLLTPKEHLNDHPTVMFTSVEEVDVSTLKAFLDLATIGTVDLLWMDLQGMEPSVLRESADVLNRIRAIHTEVSFKETYKGVELYDSFNSFLLEQGFRLRKLVRDYEDMGNALYINSHL